MFNDLNLVEIGTIRKSHGVKGQVRIKVESEFSETEIFEKANPLFISSRGLFIPYNIEDHYPAGKEYIVKLQFCDSQDYARELVDCQVFVDEKSAKYYINENPVEDSIINYTVVSDKHGKIGVVARINEIPGNPVIEVLHDNNIVMVPYVKEIVTNVDHDKKIIKINPPDGLIELYL